jgi:PKD repeat protein
VAIRKGERVGGRFSTRSAIFLALAVAGAALALSAGPASAVIMRLRTGATISYMPTRAKAATLVQPFDTAFGNLDYNGGPVMPSNSDYLIFWAPTGTQPYAAGYKTGLNTYFNDLAANNGGHQNTDSVATQYNDSAGEFAKYQVTNGGMPPDTHPYPTSGCGAGAAPSGTPCLTDAQIQTELQRFATANTLTKDLSHEYFVLLPPAVVTCFDSNPMDGCDANSNLPAYCAYHGNTPYTPGQPVIIYAVDPYVVGNGGCDDNNHPNGPSDGAIEGGLSHEHLESVTDPIPNTAWTDFATGAVSGFEMGDKCATQTGSPLGGDGSTAHPFFNQIIDGHDYWYQEEWSNQGFQCLQRFTFSGAEPTAKFTITPGSTSDTANFDATGSTAPGGVAEYHYEFEDPNSPDGPAEDGEAVPTVSHTYPTGGTHTVSLTIYAHDGTSIGTTKQVSFPTARFTDTPHPVAGHAASFDGASSASANGSIDAYSWDFGDGATATGPSPNHVYAAPGAYTVTLTATDAKGFSDTVIHNITIFTPPAASFSVRTPAPVAGQAVLFDGSSSSSEGASITGYGWNFGDGSSGSGRTPTHAYAVPGTYSVRLTVTDSLGDTATSAPQAVVVDESPHAAFVVTTAHPATGSAVQFDGSGSSDPDGAVVSYAWVLGDGSTATGATPKHAYAKPGTYAVTLSVLDSAGHLATTTGAVRVLPASKIAKLTLQKAGNGNYFLLVKVTGAGRINLGPKHVNLRKAGTARFRVHPNGRKTLRATVVYAPVLGSTIRKTATLKVPG